MHKHAYIIFLTFVHRQPTLAYQLARFTGFFYGLVIRHYLDLLPSYRAPIWVEIRPIGVWLANGNRATVRGTFQSQGQFPLRGLVNGGVIFQKCV